jgi:hypothetical protein
VRVYGLRILRVFALACVVYAAVVGFRAAGRSVLGLSIGSMCVLVALVYGVYAARRAGRTRREQLWERAIYRPELRDRAVAQLEQTLGRLSPVTHANRSERARLSVMLAELLDAQGRYDAAIATIDAVELAALSALEVGLVRHTRAVTHLRASDAAGALRALTKRELSGDIELDQRLLLLEAYARIELGEVDWGLAAAERIILAPGTHESVVAEARVVRAAGLDAAGRREEALVVLMALGRDTLTPLAELGQPRARELAKAALEGSQA